MADRTLNINPYFKAGDDVAHHLSEAEDKPITALMNWAWQLEEGAKAIRQVVEMLTGHDFDLQADTHVVEISGLKEEVLQAIEKLDLPGVWIHAWDDEFEDDEEFDEEEGDEEGEDTGGALEDQP